MWEWQRMSFLFSGVQGTIKIQGSYQGRSRGKSDKNIYNLANLIFPRIVDLVPRVFSPKSLDTNLRHSQKSLRALFQNAHVKSFGGRTFSSPVLSLSTSSGRIFSLADKKRMRNRNENHKIVRISFYFRSGWQFVGALYEERRSFHVTKCKEVGRHNDVILDRNDHPPLL